MRKLASILLIACLCCTWVGYHLVFQFQLNSVKADMRATLVVGKAHKEAMELTFTDEEFGQLELENEQEFSYEGQMYDLIQKRTERGRVVLTCISDSKETTLLQEYQKNNRRDASHLKIVQLITASFVLPQDNSITNLVLVYKTWFRRYSTPVLSIAGHVVCPPPDVC